MLFGEGVLMLVLARTVPCIPPFVAPLALGLWVLLGSCALLTVRSYRFNGQSLEIQRLLWWTTVSLEGLHRVTLDPNALRITVKGFGNGGLFAMLGWWHVTGYGWCRVFATNPKNAVVIQCGNGNFIVTPDDPEHFMREARSRLGLQ